MKLLRTPDSQFLNLVDYPFKPHYLDINDRQTDVSIRVHYIDEGEAASQPVLMLHGEPSWSFLYRKMVSPFVDAGYRVVTSNTMLPTGDHNPGEAFKKWQSFSQEVPMFPTGKIINGGTVTELPDEVLAAYDAPIIQKLVPGCQGQPHTTLQGGGHFIQEDCGEALARVVLDWLK